MAFNKTAFFAANKKNQEEFKKKFGQLPPEGLFHARLTDTKYGPFQSGSGEGAVFNWQLYDEDENAAEKCTQIFFCFDATKKPNDVAMSMLMQTLEKMGVDIADEANFDMDRALEDIIGSEVRLHISHKTGDNGTVYPNFKIKRVVLAKATSTGNAPNTTKPPIKIAPETITNQPQTDSSANVEEETDIVVGMMLEVTDKKGTSWFGEVMGVNEQKEEIIVLKFETQTPVVVKPFQVSPVSEEKQQIVKKQFEKPVVPEGNTSSPTISTEVEVESEAQFEVGMNVYYMWKGEKRVGKLIAFVEDECVHITDAQENKTRKVKKEVLSLLV